MGVTAILLTVLVAFIAYNANVGVPWERRSSLTIDVPDANRLIRGADVRIAGVTVGTISSVDTARGETGRPPYARLKVALNKDASRIPVDSTVQIRPASVLGLTYVDLRLGRSRRVLGANGTLRLAQARPSAELTDLFDIFDRATARGLQDSLAGLADGLAGRGRALNATIGSTNRLLPRLGDVAEVLAAQDTRLRPFLAALDRTTGALDAARGPLGGAMTAGAATFAALTRPGDALGESIAAAPPAERAATIALTRAKPALDEVASLAVALRPASRRLRRSVQQIDVTLRAGVPALRAVPATVPALRTALTSIRTFSSDRVTRRSLVKLADLITPTREILDILAPSQTACNMISLWGQAVFNVLAGAGTGSGPALANIVFSALGADGETLQNPRPSPDVGINAIPHQNESECESNNEVWDGTGQVVNPPGAQSRRTRETQPPPGAVGHARAAGLLEPVEGAP